MFSDDEDENDNVSGADDGPNAPSSAQGRESLKSLIVSARESEAELSRMPDDLLNKCYEEAKDSSRFFHAPSAAADFSYWRSLPSWNAEEAVALSFGKDPRVVSWAEIQKLDTSPFAQMFKERRELIIRSIKAGELKEGIRPNTFIKWAKVKKLKIPIGFASNELDASSSDNVSEEADSNIHHNTLHTFYKIILGLAVQHYSFDPGYEQGTDKSKIFALIHKDLGDLGLEVSVKVIREHLADAADWARREGIKVRRRRSSVSTE